MFLLHLRKHELDFDYGVFNSKKRAIHGNLFYKWKYQNNKSIKSRRENNLNFYINRKKIDERNYYNFKFSHFFI